MQRRLWKQGYLGVLISMCCWVSGMLWAAPVPGRFDLALWNQTHHLNLDGQWLYVPGLFMEPHEFEDILDPSARNIKILSAGASIQDHPDAPRYGTYVLRLQHPQTLTGLALFHGLYYSSGKSQVFCRNQPHRSVTFDLGQVGASVSSSTPKLSTFAIQDLSPLAAVSPCSELIIMLQISSFHHTWAGMWLPPRLGPVAEFQTFLAQQEQSYAFILGILLFVSFYGASFAFRRRQEKTAMYVALGAFLLGLRIAFLYHAASTDEGSAPWLWHLENLFIYAAGYLVPYLSLKSLKDFLPHGHLPRRLERIMNILVVGAFLVQCLTPVRWWTAYAGIFLMFGLVSVVLIVYFLIQGLIKRVDTVWPHLIGVLFAFSGMLLEILVVYRVIDYLPLNISGYGSAIWISLQLQLTAQRFAAALEKSEYLSSHLQEEVQKQTHRLTEMNRYIAENVLKRFLPPRVVADIVAGKRALDEKARSLEITVLFADLCDFTQISARQGPERTAMVLNSFLVQMTETVFEHNGTIDKFLGDGVLILFGAPEPMEPAQQAEAAWRCATAMLKALQALNAEWAAQGGVSLQMRMGMHSGPAVVGSFGGPMRSDYTAIGDTVNMASRIQNAAEPNTMLVTEEMACHLPVQARRSQASYQLKGIAGSKVLYQLEPWDSSFGKLEKEAG